VAPLLKVEDEKLPLAESSFHLQGNDIFAEQVKEGCRRTWPSRSKILASLASH